MDRKFGRNPSPLDERDYNLRDFIPKGAKFRLVTESDWQFPAPALDQEDTPHCVGFSMASFGINLPTNTRYTNKDGHTFYYQCKVLDGEPEAENGSTIRSAAKVLRNNNRIDGYAFAPDMATIKWWLLHRGPMIVGTMWTSNMMTPNEDNIVTIGGDMLGGHAYVLAGWRADNYIPIQNSWGQYWGKNGRAYISSTDFEKLFIRGGEALAAVELESPIAKRNCVLVDLFNKWFK